jgi:integrase
MRIPKLTRHKRGQGVVRIRGRDYYCGKFGDPETDQVYGRLIAEYLANRTSFGPEAPSLLVSDLVIRYLEHAASLYRGSELNNIRLIAQLVVDLYGESSAGELGAKHYRTIRDTFGQGGKSRSRQYVNKMMRLFVRLIKWCVSEEFIKPEVLAVIKCIEPLKRGRTELPESKKIKTIDPSIVAATIEHLPPVIADMVRLQELLGCRPGEVCEIKPAMIDRSRSIWEIEFEDHKTAHHDHARTLYVGPRGQAILSKYLDRDPESYCFSPTEAMQQRRDSAEAKRTTPANQGNRRGYGRATRKKIVKGIQYNDSYNTRSYGHAIRYACRKAFPAPENATPDQEKAWHKSHSWAPNQLRHNAGTEVREQFSIEHVAALHGHSNISTSQIYAKIKRDRAIEVAQTR